MLIPLGILAAAGAGAAGAGSYELIQSSILTSDTASVTFSSIPQTYKHLQLRMVARGTDTTTTLVYRFTFNGDTGANYRFHFLLGNGSSVSSQAPSDFNQIRIEDLAGAGQPANVFSPVVMDVLDYSATTKNTTTRALAGNVGTANRIYLASGLWRDTSSVTSFTIAPNSLNWVSGSRFSLYGIKG